MIRSTYFLLFLFLCLCLVCSWSLAQQESGENMALSTDGQEWTGDDEQSSESSGSLYTWWDATMGSGDTQTGSNESWIGSGDIYLSWETSTGEDIYLPSLLISEVFFDGSDERLELSNLGEQDFSGVIQFSGNAINTTISTQIPASGSLVIGRTGRSFAYMLDQSVVAYFASMSFTDTKEISVFLTRSGQVLDHFYADTGMVNHYNDKKTSIERIWSQGIYIVTWTSLDRQLNVSSPYIANPGSFTILFLDWWGNDDEGDILSGAEQDCQYLSSDPPLQIAELFRGNDQGDFYIEIVVLRDLSIQEISLSWSFLNHPVVVFLSGGVTPFAKGQRILISSGKKRENEQIFHIDNQELSVWESGWILQILSGSGQSGQVLDIVAIPSKKQGSSSYYHGNNSNCIRKMDARGRFSPWFDEVFLKYFIGSTWYKIICSPSVAIATTQGQSSTKEAVTAKTGEVLPLSWSIVSGNIWSISIQDIDYDPPGSDTNNESITLLAGLPLGEPFLTLQKPDRYIKIGTTKRYLSGTIFPGVPLVVKGSFAFPNSSKSWSEITVQLWHQNQLIDVYQYLPSVGSSVTKITQLTWSFIVTSVIDGDTFKIAYKTGEQSIRMLGLDAPEISLLRTKKKWCFADESKKYLEELLLGKEVVLEYDPTQNKTDSYKRWLNYVYLEDLLINEEMLSQWYAKEYTFKVPYLMRERFLLAQTQAQEEQLGLWDTVHCPENALTGKQMTGDDSPLFSWWEAKIFWIIPNPKGKDDNEQIALKIENEELRMKNVGGFLMTGLSFIINGKTKKIKDSIPLNQEIVLSGSFSFPNKASCVSLVLQEKVLSTICYPQPKDGETIYADGKRSFVLTQEEQSLLSAVALKKIGNTMCAFWWNIQIDCNNIPSGKTALKTKQENRMYKSFINLLQPYLKEHWSTIFYESKVYPYFSLLRAAKKNISAGIGQISTSHGQVPVYDIQEQIRIIEDFSLWYWAKRFGQVLLDEI